MATEDFYHPASQQWDISVMGLTLEVAFLVLVVRLIGEMFTKRDFSTTQNDPGVMTRRKNVVQSGTSERHLRTAEQYVRKECGNDKHSNNHDIQCHPQELTSCSKSPSEAPSGFKIVDKYLIPQDSNSTEKDELEEMLVRRHQQRESHLQRLSSADTSKYYPEANEARSVPLSESPTTLISCVDGVERDPSSKRLRFDSGRLPTLTKSHSFSGMRRSQYVSDSWKSQSFSDVKSQPSRSAGPTTPSAVTAISKFYAHVVERNGSAGPSTPVKRTVSSGSRFYSHVVERSVREGLQAARDDS